MSALIAAAGIDEPFQEHGLQSRLEDILRVWAHFRLPAKISPRKYKQYLDAIEKVFRLLRGFSEHQIVVAAMLRKNPGADLTTISSIVEHHGGSLAEFKRDLTEHMADIKYSKTMQRHDYHKNLTTKFVIEPVVRELLGVGAETSPQTRPITAIAHATFKLFEIPIPKNASEVKSMEARFQKAWRSEEAKLLQQRSEN